jgi:hypothetical protein
MAPVEAHSGREPHLTEQMEAAFVAALDALDRILVLREQFAASLRQVSRESRHECKDNECRITQEWLKTIVPCAMHLKQIPIVWTTHLENIQLHFGLCI